MKRKNWKDEFMIQTAIIAFLLIGAMFIFTECGDNETKEVTKVEVDKDGIPKYVTEKSHDLSYDKRDSEIAAASYIKDNAKEGAISHDSSGASYNLATKDINSGIRTSHRERDKEVRLASYGTNGKVDVEVSEKEIEDTGYPKLTIFPNPFNKDALIKYKLANPGYVELVIYDMFNTIVKKIDVGFMQKMDGSFELDLNDEAPGVYLCTLYLDGLPEMTIKIIKDGL